METIVLRNTAEDGTPLQASFTTDDGLCLVSYRKGDVEVMDTSAASPGALIGPHYEDRTPGIIPPLPDGFAPPKNKAKNGDPFSNGIARYAPWQVTSDATSLKGALTGKQEWQSQPLSALEGQQFTMGFQAALTPQGLVLNISVVSDADSLAGLDYRFRLPAKQGSLHADVKDTYFDGRTPTRIPAEWHYSSDRRLTVDLANPCDATFHPFFNPLEGKIHLKATDYQLDFHYSCTSQENAWQLIRPSGAAYVAIRPLSARMPFRPCLTVSSLTARLVIQS